jgi:aspartate/methionine/tyrosine aminotransferase
MRPPISSKASRFNESVIREMTRVCNLHGGVNLAQGFPDFEAPEAMREAAKRAIDAGINQYAVTWGAPRLHEAITRHTLAYNGIPTDADAHVTVCCGATEAMVAAMLGVLDPGDEVVIFEPFYENYGPDCILSGAVPRFVELRPPHWSFDPDEVRAAFGERTRAVVINTPHNPTGKVFTREELRFLADLCVEHDVIAITDEIYEYILYDGAEHVSIATLPGMQDRTITISGLSKTWSATGWRIGWCIAPEAMTAGIRKVHDFLTVGAPAPLQDAAADALDFGPDYFRDLAEGYAARRDLMCAGLEAVGLPAFVPKGAYYAMVDIRGVTHVDDVTFAHQLVAEGGVATVPGSSFFAEPEDGAHLIRFCFAKRHETLEAAVERLKQRIGAH